MTYMIFLLLLFDYTHFSFFPILIYILLAVKQTIFRISVKHFTDAALLSDSPLVRTGPACPTFGNAMAYARGKASSGACLV